MKKSEPKPTLPDFGIAEGEVEFIKRREKHLHGKVTGPFFEWAEHYEFLGWLFLVSGGMILVLLGIMIDLCLDLIGLGSRPHHPKFAAYSQFLEAEQRWQWNLESYWYRLDGLDLERQLAALLKQLGHKVCLTPHSNDQGIDLFADESIIIQCKAHAQPVGPAVARELLGAKQMSRVERAILVSPRGFTRGALAVHGIEFWDVNKLIELRAKLS